MNRRWLAAAMAAATVALTPGPALAVPLLQWTLDMSPSTVPEDQLTAFTLTAQNALVSLQPLGCLEVDLPSSFVIEAVGAPVASNGQSWSSSIDGQAVVVHVNTPGGGLGPLAWVTFTIQARPTAPGSFAWQNHAHIQFDCTDAERAGTPLDVTVTPAPTPSPSPSPSASPSSTPKPSATPTASPSLPLPSLPLPSLPLPSVPLPTAPPTPTPSLPATSPPTPPHTSLAPNSTPTPTPSAPRPGESATPDPGASPTPVAAGRGGPGLPPSSPTPGSADDPVGAVRLTPEPGRGLGGLGIELGLGDLLADVQLWSVPLAAIGVPGLILIAWVALQAAGVLLWIPAVRRMRGDDRDPRHPLRVRAQRPH